MRDPSAQRERAVCCSRFQPIASTSYQKVLKLEAPAGGIKRDPKANCYRAPRRGSIRSMSKSNKPVDELARGHAPRAIELLADEMENSPEARDRIRAAESLLDRGYGKPAQAIIQVPANRRQAALLAAMSDDDLVAVIEQKQLPSLAPRQPLITVPAAAPKKRSMQGHMPEDSLSDPLLT